MQGSAMKNSHNACCTTIHVIIAVPYAPPLTYIHVTQLETISCMVYLLVYYWSPACMHDYIYKVGLDKYIYMRWSSL